MKKMEKPENYVMILRLLGTTRASSNAVSVLKSIIHQLKVVFNNIETISENSTNNLLELRDGLIDCIIQVSQMYPEKKLIIFLDSIDQLIESDYSVEWLPVEVPQ